MQLMATISQRQRCAVSTPNPHSNREAMKWNSGSGGQTGGRSRQTGCQTIAGGIPPRRGEGGLPGGAGE
jgi:hypothetical protein